MMQEYWFKQTHRKQKRISPPAGLAALLSYVFEVTEIMPAWRQDEDHDAVKEWIQHIFIEICY